MKNCSNNVNIQNKILCVCRYTDIWRNKIHEDGMEKSLQQNAEPNEILPIIRSVKLREVKTINKINSLIEFKTQGVTQFKRYNFIKFHLSINKHV